MAEFLIQSGECELGGLVSSLHLCLVAVYFFLNGLNRVERLRGRSLRELYELGGRGGSPLRRESQVRELQLMHWDDDVSVDYLALDGLLSRHL